MRARTVPVDIPAGVDTGVRLQMPGSGEAGPAGGPNGDLYLEIKVRNHDVFSRNGDDLLVHARGGDDRRDPRHAHDGRPRSTATSTSSCEPGLQSGEILTVKDRGVTRLRGSGPRRPQDRRAGRHADASSRRRSAT